MSLTTAPREDETRTRLSVYGKSLVAGLVGVAIGLAATYATTDGVFPFGAAESGPWTSWPKTGGSDADPYAWAIISRQAQAPLGSGEGLSFIASTDDEGKPLNGSCEYWLSGSPPVSRLWTLGLFTPEGKLLPAGPGRRAISSDQLLRSSDGAFEIAVAPSARAGNWLSAPARTSFALMLNLYDTSVSPSQSALAGVELIKIRRGACL